jgi:uncharacterized protein (DUF433 family)
MKTSLGRYVVADSMMCHGQPTFRGTRILVKDVIDQVAQGMAWQTIEEQWRGAVSSAAIAEALRLAGQALLDRPDAYLSHLRQRGSNFPEPEGAESLCAVQ